MKTFNDSEVQLIKDSIEFRKSNNDFENHITELNNIIKKLNLPITYLKTREKSIINGCLRVFVIYPNKEIFNKSEYELMLFRNDIELKCNRIDIAHNIINLIQKKNKEKQRVFKPTFDKLDLIAESKQIYYSISNTNNLYKVGIVTEKDKGFKLRMSNEITNFEIGSLLKSSFLSSSKPIALMNYLSNLEKLDQIQGNELKLLKILETSQN